MEVVTATMKPVVWGGGRQVGDVFTLSLRLTALEWGAVGGN